MSKLPESIIVAWANREGPIVLATVDAKGVPNAIYATCVQMSDASYFVIADNYFSKTRDNLLETAQGSLLFISKEGKSFQAKGRLEYHREGRFF